MNVSQFGEKFVRNCGILQLMDDLGNAMAGGQDMIMLGGGNPSRIPEVEACLRERMATGLGDVEAFAHALDRKVRFVERFVVDAEIEFGHLIVATQFEDIGGVALGDFTQNEPVGIECGKL